MSLALIVRFALIAFVAAIAAWIPVAASFVFDGAAFGVVFYLGLFVPALLGSFTIGYPVALLAFYLSWRHLVASPTTLAMVSVLAGIMMLLTSYAIAEEEGVLALGIPAFIAALTYGILGWFWILRPLRASEQP